MRPSPPAGSPVGSSAGPPRPRAGSSRPDPTTDLREHLPALRVALLQQRRFRIEQLAGLTVAAPVGRVQEEVADTLRHGARVALAGIEAALTRLDRGTFGRCVHCDAPIPLERLEILPAVAACTTCHRTHDQPT